jgi:hypothetical protein
MGRHNPRFHFVSESLTGARPLPERLKAKDDGGRNRKETEKVPYTAETVPENRGGWAIG